MKIAILIPAYRPDQTLLQLVEELRADGWQDIVVVDDGGGPDYQPIFEALKDTATVLTHVHNRGKGAALKTGFAHLAETRPDFVGVVTVDADGQHRPPDIRNIAAELDRHPEALVLGVRSFTRAGVPLRSLVGNLVTRFVFFVMVGKFVRDTQTGLRGVPQALLPDLIKIQPDRYEYELEMLLACRKRPFRQVTIETVYLDGNKSSHFNPIVDSLKIYATLFRCRWRHLSEWLGFTRRSAG